MADTNPAAILQEKMKALRQEYVAQLPAKLAQVDELWKALSADWSEHNLHLLHRLIHSLTGSGATFGMADLSEAARSLEEDLSSLLKDGEGQSSEISKRLSGKLDQLRGAALINVEPSQSSSDNEFSALLISRVRHIGSKRILIVDRDSQEVQELAAQLSYFGYDVGICENLETFRVAFREDRDVLVLMAVSLTDGSLDGVHAIHALQDPAGQPLAAIFVAETGDVRTRLEAVRAGGMGYFVKPVRLSELIDKLDALTDNHAMDAFKILIVDDSVTLSRFHAAVLGQAGMETRIVNSPLEILSSLQDFSPDLILMDLYMPDCTGIELSKVIRQLDAFVGIPIVYLSSEKDADRQNTAMSVGGDDFLSKPIRPQHLVAAVSNRIERARLLRSLMIRDSLTGLLNHSAIRDQLEREIARARRAGGTLSLAMVDIDHFKHINDNYGHSAGDCVIKSLARILKQRLRETDIVGRYGGEEFAVILPETPGRAALQVLDGIREDYARIRHLPGEHGFSSSFSVGIAELGSLNSALQMGEAADKALYAAKHAGRNRIHLAGS